MTRRTQLAALATLGLVAAVIPVAQAQSSSATDAAHARSSAPSLFGAAPAAAARQSADTSAGAVKRSRYVSFKSNVLTSAAKGDELDLSFFDDADFTGTVEHVDKQALFTAWTGSLDTEFGSFSAIKSAGRFSVTASTLQGSFTMTRATDGTYQVAEVVQPTPDENDIVAPDAEAAGSAARQAAPAPTAEKKKHGRSTVGDDGSVIDLVVMYTARAAAAYGGTAGIQAEAAKNVTYTNVAYQRSGVPLTARLVAVVPTATAEVGGDGLGTDLDRLTAPGDGFYDEAQTYVAQFHADDTLLLVAPPPSGVGICGIGNLSPGNPVKNAFAVVSTGSCTNGYYSFPHELGHNMGATHDPYTLQDGGVGTGDFKPEFPYGYGYVDPSFRFYTMMAYYDQCRDQGTTTAQQRCPQLDQYSNPAVAYAGATTGTSTTSNVALLLSQTRIGVTSHQQSQLYPTPVKIKGKVQPGRRVHVKFQKWINQGVHYQYTWYRNGKPIKKATKKRYKITRHDIGKKLTVLVTGSASYYAPVAVGSEARKVKGQKPHHRGKHHKPRKHHHKGKHHKG